ncbi:hypothetical protein AAY473_024285 [Plecturocebus cupreus]
MIAHCSLKLLGSSDPPTSASQNIGITEGNSLALLPRLQCSGSSDSPASASRVAEITGTHHHAWLIFVCLVEMGFQHVGKAVLELSTLGDLPAMASQSAGITGMSHPAQPQHLLSFTPIHWKHREDIALGKEGKHKRLGSSHF